MCDQCWATNPVCKNGNGKFNYMNFRKDAEWYNTLVDNDKYLDECPYEHLSPFLQLEGHCKEMCWSDWAHLDPLGLGRDLGAALIKSMYTRNELTEGTMDEQLRALWDEFNRDRKTRGKSVVAGYFSAAGVGMDNM